MTHSEETKQYISEKLNLLTPIFAKASVGDFSQDVEIPEDDDGFIQLYTGIQVMLDVIREKISSLEKEMEERKRQQEELLRIASIVEFSNDAIIGKDLTGIVTTWNPTAEKIYGYSEQEIVGKSIQLLFPEDKKNEFESIMQRIRAGEQVAPFETKRLTKDMRVIDMSVTISPIKDPSGIVIGASDIGRDISESKRQQEEIARLAAIVESSDEAIIGLSLQGTITSWNKGAQNLYGYSEEELLGKPDTLLILQDHAHEWDELRNKLSLGETIQNFETVHIAKNGRRIDVSITFSPIKDSSGKIIGSSAIIGDITERKKIDNMKNEFVALASHQLKTPLTSIKWYSELLLKNITPQFTEKQIEYLQEIHKSNKRMIYLINALLNVSRIDLGTFIVHPVTANLIEIIDSVIEENTMQITDRNIHIEKHYQQDLPPILLDINVMRIILSNLILNAIRYTPKSGKITVTVSKDESAVHIVIADNGIGIPVSERDKIFKKFSRADNAMIQNTDGSGLGLYMVKSLVDQTGGSISFTSQENVGTEFIVSFPLSGMKEKEGTRQLH